jgi:hypothetical protein
MTRLRTRSKLYGVALAAIALALWLAPLSAPDTPPYLATANSYPASLTSSIVEAAPVPTNSSNSVYFRQTAHYLKDAFLNYWLTNGGVSIYGYPISEEYVADGVPTQYFERSKFEYRPESNRPWKVELANVGSLVSMGRTFAPAAQTSTTDERTYFEQTGHTLGGTFGQYWKANGGLAIFGFPISEEFQEAERTVQYFERARFELGLRGQVQLGLAGKELMAADVANGLDEIVGQPQSRPGYNMSFRGEATVFSADWERVIRLNKSWGNLPQDYVGRGLYAAAPADLNLYGRWARVTRGNRSIFVQFIDVINWPDIPYVRSRGIVIDLGQESFRALGQYNGGRYEVSFDVFWPGEGPDR